MDDTIREMRDAPRRGLRPRRSFMKHSEVRKIRTQILRATQQKLAEQLVDPATGAPVSRYLVCKWERGERPVPLWAARHLAALAQAAREHDLKEGT